MRVNTLITFSFQRRLISTMVIVPSTMVDDNEKMDSEIEASCSRPDTVFFVPAGIFALIETLVALIHRLISVASTAVC